MMIVVGGLHEYGFLRWQADSGIMFFQAIWGSESCIVTVTGIVTLELGYLIAQVGM